MSSQKYIYNPLTQELEERSNPSPHVSSSTEPKQPNLPGMENLPIQKKPKEPTVGTALHKIKYPEKYGYKYTSKLDQVVYPKAGTAPSEIKKTTQVQKLTEDLEKVKKTNEVLMKYGKPDKKFLEDLEPVKFEADIGFVGQMSGKKIDGMKEAVKMNDFVDVTDKKEWDTLKRVQKINYETGTTPKPYWMAQEEKYKSDTRTPVQKKRDEFKAKQGGRAKTVKTNFGEVKIPGQPETKPEVKTEVSQNVQTINDMEDLAKQRLESQILENKFHEIMKPQRDPDMSKGIASVDGAEVFKKTVDLADSKWRNKRNNRTNYGLNTILGEPK